MNEPLLLSVILPVYEVPREWFILAIESILNQTFRDFEFIIVLDNPSNPIIESLIKDYSTIDHRIIILKNSKNLGLSKSLNKAIKISKGKYIARMDADDISILDRFEKQIKYLDTNVTISLCGGQAVKIDETGKEIGYTKNALEFDLIKKLIPFENPTTHPSWMVRRIDILEVGLYRNFPNAEDYDLITRLITKGKRISNLSDVLLKYRMHFASQSGKKSIEQKLCLKYIQQLYHQRRRYGFDTFKEQELTLFLNKNKPLKNSTENILWKARIEGTNKFFLKYFYIIQSFLFFKIERKYLIDLCKARLIKLSYNFNLF